ncbi:MAG: MBL fold metallo-hydrolase [Syntrophaceae bacterium]|nr:MBL fold metallo-hydrolase [Syntrophaceae bacterium]
MDIHFLGTNGWYDTETGNTICTLIRTDHWEILLDAGYGIAKADRYLAAEPENSTVLLLSHFHLDHVAGLHTLAKFRFPKGLIIAGPDGSRQTLNVLVNAPFTIPLADLSYPVDVLELPDDLGRIPFPLLALPLRHTGITLGFRIEAEGLTVAYCPDTGYCENALSLARGADLLIAECAYRSGQGNEDWPHLNPETAARIALEAGARRLVLVHFEAWTYPTFRERDESEAAARRIFAETLAARDDMLLSL